MKSQRAISILVDDTGRLGPLSYLVPKHMTLAVGDAVTVPFGKKTRHGLVLGKAANTSMKLKTVAVHFGSRVSPLDMEIAFELATKHYASIAQIAKRLSPTTNRNSTPLDAGEIKLVARQLDEILPTPEKNWTRRVIIRSPLSDPARLAALEAERLSSLGQILILCPTVKLVEKVLNEFSSGAARIDSKAKAGTWNGWRTGSVKVVIGTRSAALYSPAVLGGIIIVEEEHPGHMEVSLPYTNVREIALLRSKAHNCALSMIALCPTAQAIAHAKVFEVPNSRKLWPSITMIDKSTLHPSLRYRPPLLLKKTATKSMPVIVLTDKNPSTLICVKCYLPRPCPTCVDFCAHRPDSPCSRCGALGVCWVGWGASRVKNSFPQALALTLKELEELPPATRLVVLPDFASLLKLPGLQPLHSGASTLLRILQTAGKGGEVVSVHSGSQHSLLKMLSTRNTLDIAKEVWEYAKQEKLPPFGHIVTLRSGNKSAPNCSGFPGHIYGPRRIKDQWEVLIHIEKDQLAALNNKLGPLRKRGKIRISLQ
jgi:primosomal protein N'